MPNPAVGQGLFLAELIQYYHHYRSAFLTWSIGIQPDDEAAVLNYQRAMLAWYEARIRSEQPYTGDVYHFIQVASTHYAGHVIKAEGDWGANNQARTHQDPLRYLPHPISLNDTQKIMSRQFLELGQNCRELLLLAYYHRLSDDRLSEVLEMADGPEQSATKRRQCLLMVRERWQNTGIMDALKTASSAQHLLIDRYYRHELNVAERWEVEALRSTDPLLLEAMSLREEWQDCLFIAGRQDTLATLQREEAAYRPSKSAPAALGRVKINLPNLPRVSLPKDVQTYLVVALLGLLGWLLFTTFVGGSKEEQLFRTYFKPFPSPETPINGTAADNDLAKMLLFYDQGDYLTAYDELLPAASAYPSAPLYLGISALALNQPQRALDWFNQYETTNEYRPYADWYTALAHLALGRRPAALSLLVEIASTLNHPYELPATQLIEQLE